MLGAYIPSALMTIMIPLAGGPAWLAFGLLIFDQFFGDILWTVHMVPQEHPKERRPRDHGGEKALHGPITAPFVGPAGHAPHCHPTGHRQHRFGDPTELADGGPIQTLA